MDRSITIISARPGDVLASNVTLANGSILLSSGAKLTKEYIEKLRRFGVTSISIK